MISTLGWHYWGWKNTKCVVKQVHCVIVNGSTRTNQRKCGKCSVSQVQTKTPVRCVNWKLSQFIMLLPLTFPRSSARKSEWQDIPVTFFEDKKPSEVSGMKWTDITEQGSFLPSETMHISISVNERWLEHHKCYNHIRMWMITKVQ